MSGAAPRARASASISAKTLPAAAPATFGPAVAAAAAAASAAAFFAQPASSTPATSRVRLDVEAGAREHVGELAARSASVERGEHDRGAVLERVGGVRGTGERGDRARLHALGGVGGRERAERRHEPLRDDEHAGALRGSRSPCAASAAGRSRAGHGEADEVVDGQLELGARGTA